MRKSLPTVLLVLSFPAGVVGYLIGVRLMEALPVPEQAQAILTLFVPLFVAGLVMVPFLVLFFDRKAKEDLAAHARDSAESARTDGDEPGS